MKVGSAISSPESETEKGKLISREQLNKKFKPNTTQFETQNAFSFKSTEPIIRLRQFVNLETRSERTKKNRKEDEN